MKKSVKTSNITDIIDVDQANPNTEKQIKYASEEQFREALAKTNQKYGSLLKKLAE